MLSEADWEESAEGRWAVSWDGNTEVFTWNVHEQVAKLFLKGAKHRDTYTDRRPKWGKYAHDFLKIYEILKILFKYV